MRDRSDNLDQISFLKELVAQGGPEIHQYAILDDWTAQIHDDLNNDRISETELADWVSTMGDLLSSSTMQGFARTKPHGYAGDFEIIDRIYQQHTSSDPAHQKWDLYFHSVKATRAVRNRKDYFKQLLQRTLLSKPNASPINVLNIASGPARDMYEFFNENPDAHRIVFDCIELDSTAIGHAKALCSDYLSNITFHQRNALRFKPSHPYQLIWSAGLFDYFNDKQFKFLLARLYAALAVGGEIVVGNFSDENPSRGYMEIVGEWYLNHRSVNELIQLAMESGIPQGQIRVGYEAEKVNLFLHINKSS
jgi:extracellular factor (EF) 3-hydroxypalmitic acid methyl ester biosynthesis protein